MCFNLIRHTVCRRLLVMFLFSSTTVQVSRRVLMSWMAGCPWMYLPASSRHCSMLLETALALTAVCAPGCAPIQSAAGFLTIALSQMLAAQFEPPRCALCKSYRALEWRPKDPGSENSEVVCDKCEANRLCNAIGTWKQQREQAVAAHGAARQQLLSDFLAEVWGHALRFWGTFLRLEKKDTLRNKDFCCYHCHDCLVGLSLGAFG